jgi:hypothetical protein
MVFVEFMILMVYGESDKNDKNKRSSLHMQDKISGVMYPEMGECICY